MFQGRKILLTIFRKIPGCFFFIGCKPKGIEKAYFNHHPKFDIDEDASGFSQISCTSRLQLLWIGVGPEISACHHLHFVEFIDIIRGVTRHFSISLIALDSGQYL